MGHIQLQNLRIGFNNAGKDMFYEFSSINQDVLHGLKEFLTDLNCTKILIDHHQEPQTEAFDYGVGRGRRGGLRGWTHPAPKTPQPHGAAPGPSAP